MGLSISPKTQGSFPTAPRKWQVRVTIVSKIIMLEEAQIRVSSPSLMKEKRKRKRLVLFLRHSYTYRRQ